MIAVVLQPGSVAGARGAARLLPRAHGALRDPALRALHGRAAEERLRAGREVQAARGGVTAGHLGPRGARLQGAAVSRRRSRDRARPDGRDARRRAASRPTSTCPRRRPVPDARHRGFAAAARSGVHRRRAAAEPARGRAARLRRRRSRRCAGAPGSEAAWHPFVHEPADGEDCLDWVLAPAVVRRAHRRLRNGVLGVAPRST